MRSDRVRTKISVIEAAVVILWYISKQRAKPNFAQFESCRKQDRGVIIGF